MALAVTAEETSLPTATGSTEASPDLRAIADGLFTWPAAEPQLISSRCGRCATTTFPSQPSCPRCTSTDVHEHLLARKGTLWTWTVQGFRPKSPPYEGGDEFVPYPVGYVELPGEAKVEALLVEVAIDELEIGMAMELVIVPFHSAVSGDDAAMFAFRPSPQEDPS